MRILFALMVVPMVALAGCTDEGVEDATDDDGGAFTTNPGAKGQMTVTPNESQEESEGSGDGAASASG